MIEIREVKSKKDIKLFANFPLELYKGCPYYVPSMRSEEINFFDPKKNFNLNYNDVKGFICFKDGKMAGRIAGIINYRYNDISGKKYIRFSRFECIDDLEVFKALLGAVENWGKEKGLEIIHGPWGFNDMDREGMLTEGFDVRSTYATNYYYPYFCQRMVELGFEDESKWVEFKFNIPKQPDERIDRLSQKIKAKYKLRDVAETMSVKEIIKKYGDKMFETLTEAYGHLDGYVPLEGKERDSVLDSFVSIVNTKYISFLIDENDDVAGFGVVLPSIAKAMNKHKGRLFPFGFIGTLKSIFFPKELEMALIGVKHAYKNTGINALIISRILNNIIDTNIELIESNPMLEHNKNIQNQWKFVDSCVWKKRQTYQKPIGSLIKD